MSALALLPLLAFCAAAGLGLLAVIAVRRSSARRRPAPPPRGFRPVVIQGGKAGDGAEKIRDAAS